MRMESLMKGSGSTIWLKELGSLSTLMAQFILESGNLTRNGELGEKCLLMEPSSRDNMRTE